MLRRGFYFIALNTVCSGCGDTVHGSRHNRRPCCFRPSCRLMRIDVSGAAFAGSHGQDVMTLAAGIEERGGRQYAEPISTGAHQGHRLVCISISTSSGLAVSDTCLL